MERRAIRVCDTSKKPGDSENRTFSEAIHKVHFFRMPFSLLTHTHFQLTIALIVLLKMAPPPLPLPFPRTFVLRLTLFHDGDPFLPSFVLSPSFNPSLLHSFLPPPPSPPPHSPPTSLLLCKHTSVRPTFLTVFTRLLPFAPLSSLCPSFTIHLFFLLHSFSLPSSAFDCLSFVRFLLCAFRPLSFFQSPFLRLSFLHSCALLSTLSFYSRTWSFKFHNNQEHAHTHVYAYIMYTYIHIYKFLPLPSIALRSFLHSFVLSLLRAFLPLSFLQSPG